MMEPMTVTMFRGGRVHNPAEPHATCIAITDGLVSWIGPDTGVEQAGEVDEYVDLDGLFVAPAFVDAHVHTTDAGLARTGLDLRSATSLADLLSRLRGFADGHRGAVVWAHGWDETDWPERRPPTRAEIDAVIGDRPAYVSRIDVHSAVVSSRLADDLDEVLAGYDPSGPLTRASHHQARLRARQLLTAGERDAAQRSFLEHCAATGTVAVHECGFGDPAGLADLAGLLALETPVQIRAYLGAAVSDPAEAAALLASSGAHALGGDLSVDGALGSHTAALSVPYNDSPGRGARYLSTEQITEHLVACAQAGIQPGFHAIGDDAVDAVAEGVRRAAERLGGTLPLAVVTPRVEHAEMIGEEAIATLSGCGAVASVQPLFDASWGGSGNMYELRLGADRARPMNPFARMAAAGVLLALGSDSPVTAADPWAAVQAAVHHRTPGAGLTPRAAFTAHTRGGWRAAQQPDRGVLTVGAPADLAIWRAGELVRPEAAEMAQRWSTDPRSRVPLLPDLTPGVELPRCVATLAGGRAIHDGDGLLAGTSLAER